MVDGFSEVLGTLRPDAVAEIEGTLRDANASAADAREILRDLWVCLATEAVERAPGRLHSVHEAPILLAVMRELAREGWALLDHLPPACWETAEAGLRGMREAAPSAPRPPCGPESSEQRGRKSPNCMSLASHALARVAEAAGMIPFPLAHNVPARVGKLRAYGNAIVPEIAAIFIQAYTGTEAPRA
jgi:hypothetical protein